MDQIMPDGNMHNDYLESANIRVPKLAPSSSNEAPIGWYFIKDEENQETFNDEWRSRQSYYLPTRSGQKPHKPRGQKHLSTCSQRNA